MDQNRAKLEHANINPPIVFEAAPPPGYPDYQAQDLVRTNDLRTEQDAIKKGVNEPTMAHLLGQRGPQIAKPASDAPEFRPPKEAAIGDLVTGMPQGDQTSAQALEAGDLISGGKRPPNSEVYLSQLPSDEAAEGE